MLTCKCACARWLPKPELGRRLQLTHQKPSCTHGLRPPLHMHPRRLSCVIALGDAQRCAEQFENTGGKGSWHMVMTKASNAQMQVRIPWCTSLSPVLKPAYAQSLFNISSYAATGPNRLMTIHVFLTGCTTAKVDTHSWLSTITFISQP